MKNHRKMCKVKQGESQAKQRRARRHSFLETISMLEIGIVRGAALIFLLVSVSRIFVDDLEKLAHALAKFFGVA